MNFFSLKKTNIAESIYSKVSKMTKETSHKRNQFSNNGSLTDIRSLVFRSFELGTNSVFNDSSNSSEVLSDSTISDSCRTVNKKEAIELLPSSYESNLSSSFSTSMPYIFNDISDVRELENTQDDVNEVFTSMKNNSLNLFELENLDNEVSTSIKNDSLSLFEIGNLDNDNEVFTSMKNDSLSLFEIGNLDNEVFTSMKNDSLSLFEIGNLDNDNEVFTSMKNDSLNLFELGNLDNDNEIFTSMKNDSLNLFEIENLDNDENSLKSLICVIDEDKKTSLFNLFSRGKTLNSEANVFNPKLLKSNKNKYYCPRCLKSFGIPSRLKKHIKTHRIKPNDSEIDDETTSLGSFAINDTCVELDFETREKCQNIKQRQKDVQCTNCLKSFNCSSKLLQYTKTHVGLKSYTCHLCSKAFLEKSNLIAPMRIRRNEQSYICEKCEKSFSTKSNLTRHMQSHMREEQFTCCKCGKKCSSEKKLAIHFRIHETISHKCPECGNVFQNKSNLNNHLKIHSNERKLSCDFCDYRARWIYHLERHIQRNHVK